METPPPPNMETPPRTIEALCVAIFNLLSLSCGLLLDFLFNNVLAIGFLTGMFFLVFFTGDRMKKSSRVIRCISHNHDRMFTQLKEQLRDILTGIQAFCLFVIGLVRLFVLLIWAAIAVVCFAFSGGFTANFPALKDDGSEDAINHWIWSWIIENVLFLKQKRVPQASQPDNSGGGTPAGHVTAGGTSNVTAAPPRFVFRPTFRAYRRHVGGGSMRSIPARPSRQGVDLRKVPCASDEEYDSASSHGKRKGLTEAEFWAEFVEFSAAKKAKMAADTKP